ncbi:MAG: zinc metallopeptidase [Gammaproteobacteria bacterium]|nr:zinc metallopeptidase [Gammaproteobacteria bacterium]
MVWLLLIVVVLALVIVPGWWVNRTLKKYSVDYPDLPGTGGELAQHLVDRFEIPVKVEQVEQGDHYDPEDRAVRLSQSFYSGRSLSAVAVAAHEVGHAIQHNEKYKPLIWRSKLVKLAYFAEKFGSGLFLLVPIMALITRSPISTGVLLLVAAVTVFLSVIVHLVTLPVEWDASFGRALPLLEQGNYLAESELKVARKVLLAAALTYVSGALLSLINVWRWIAIMRGRVF